MPLGQPLIAQLAALAAVAFVVAPLVTLLHELGHAAVALLVSDGRVQALVGRPPALLRLSLGRLRVSFSPLPPRGVPIAGLCVRERTSPRPRDELAVVLAGPAMSALASGALAVAALRLVATDPWPALVLLYGAVTALASFLYNADPRPATEAERSRGVVVRDGPRALLCYRLWRAGAPMPATSRPPPPRARPSG